MEFIAIVYKISKKRDRIIYTNSYVISYKYDDFLIEVNNIYIMERLLKKGLYYILTSKLKEKPSINIRKL